MPPELVASFIDVESGWNQALFEAYLQYCFSPKHTVGEQLLDVRRCRLAGARAGAHGWPFRIAQYGPIQRVDGMLMAVVRQKPGNTESRGIVQRSKITADLSAMLKTLKVSAPKQILLVEESPSATTAA